MTDIQACTKSELEIFRPIDVQVAMTDGKWITYSPANTLTNTDVIEFAVPGTTNEVVDLNNTSLYVRAKITNADDTSLASGKKYRPVNNFLAALFKNIELSINGQLLTRSTREIPYKDMLKRLTQCDSPGKNHGSLSGQELMAGFQMDTPGKADDYATNVKGAKRDAWIAESKTFELRGRPCLDLFDCDRSLLPGADMTIKFYVNDPSFFIQSDETAPNVKIVFDEVKLYVRRVTIAQSFLDDMKEVIKKQDAIYPFTRREFNSVSIAAGLTQFGMENLFRGQLATRYFIALVDSKAYTGDYALSPFNFQHFDLSEVEVLENGQNVAYHKPLKLEMKDNKNVVNAYYNFLESIGGIGERALCSPISFEDYANGCTIFSFTRAPDLCHGEAHIPATVGNISISLTFDKALPKAVMCLVMAEFDSKIQITQYKNVVTDYAV